METISLLKVVDSLQQDFFRFGHLQFVSVSSKFQFRWLKNSVNELGDAAPDSLIFYHLKLNVF